MRTVKKCKCCGRYMSLRHGGQYVNGKFIKEPKCSIDHDNKDSCFECQYWNERIEYMDNHPDMMIPFVADHRWFVANIDPKEKNSHFKGFGGRKMEVHIDGCDYIFDNVWNGSEIPKRFWKQLPNNAVMRWL